MVDLRDICFYCEKEGPGSINYIWGQLWVHDDCMKKLLLEWMNEYETSEKIELAKKYINSVESWSLS